MSKTLKKTLSIIVAILMIVTSVPMAFAAEDLTDDITSVTLKDTDNDGYYEIATADELKAFANLVNAGNTAINVELTSDIVLNENVITEDGQLSDNSESFEVWVPIGNSDVKYTGVFDGAGHVISGLYYKGNGEYAGLFGAIDGKYQDKSVGAIRDLYLIDSYFDIESSDRWFRVGGLAGYSYYAHFDNCYVEAQFNLRSTYHAASIYLGGISGMTYSTAENCFSDLAVSITKDKNASAPWVGGIYGNGSSTAVIINCHTNCDSVSTGNPQITNSTASRTAEEFENGTLCSLVGFHPCESTEGKKATCTEAGWKSQYCTACDYTESHSEIPATGHTLTSVKAKTPTCTEAGYEAYEYCTVCDYTTYKEIPAVNHKDTLIQVVGKDVTCTEVGYAAYEYCTACDYTTYEEIPALGHVFSTSGICDVCGEVCVHESIVEGKCDDCGAEIEVVTITMTDSWGDGWNGNAIAIEKLIDGVYTEVARATFEDGDTATYNAFLDKDGSYVFKWIQGSYSNECSFVINVDGEDVYEVTSASGLTNGQEFYRVCEHKTFTDGKCDCGYECPHAGQTGTCTICGKIIHTHNYEYTASGNTITATCTASGTCDAPDGAYLKLVVPTKYSWKQYSATAKEIEVENTIADISYEVDYCCDGGCINAGSHTASVTLGGETATVGFEIEKYYVSQASLIMSTRTKVYDGTTDAPGEINALKFYMATGSEIINLPADGYQATVRYETPEVGDRKVIWQWVKVTDQEAMKNHRFGYNDFENGLNSDFSITKRPITVTPEANEVSIGNQPNAGNKVIVGGDYGLADNQTITVTYQHIDSSAVGEKELIIDTVTILDANGNDVTSNYEITTVNGICDVVECPHETYTDGVCDECGYECDHAKQTDTCTICGMNLHTCDFTGEWKYDSEKHWKECECGEVTESAHVYTDGVCDVCGYECLHENWTDGTCDACGYDCEHAFDTDANIMTALTCERCGYTYKSDKRWAEGVYETYYNGLVAMLNSHYYDDDEIVAYFALDTVDGEESSISFDWAINQGFTEYGEFSLHFYHNGKEVITHDFSSTANPYDNILSEEYKFTAEGETQIFKFVFKKDCYGYWYDDGRTAYLNIKDHSHVFGEATDTQPASCKTCNKTQCEIVGHDWSNLDNVCAVCGYECAHESTYRDLIRPVQNADGTWDKGKIVEICNICGNSSFVQEVERDHEGYKVFDETAAELEAILNSGKMTDTWKNDYTNRLNGLRNSAYYQVYTEIETAIPSMTESLKSIIAEIEAGIADGTMIKADFTYMTSLFDEINALIDNDPNKLIPSESGRFQGIYYGYYMSCKNNGNHSQFDYDQNMAGNNWEGQIEDILAGVKDGTMLKADYTEIDEAIAEIDEKLADENITDEAKAGLEEIKAELEEMKADGNTSAADLAELEKALEDYETELDAGIEDGSAVKVDGLGELGACVGPIEQAIKEKYGEIAYQYILNSMSDEDEAERKAILSEAMSLTGSLKDNEDKLAELKGRMEALLAKIENCLNGTHNGLKFEVTEEAKCGENAIESATCTLCGETVTREVEDSALTHSFTKYEVTEEAKCGVEGKETAYCDNGCGTIEVRAIPATNHKDTLVEVEGKAATCTEAGYEAYEYCTACDYTTYKEISATNHKGTIVKVGAKAPTCTAVGYEAYEYCTACDYTTYKEIPARNHNNTIVQVEAQEATCTEAGWEAYEYCLVCDYTTYEEIPALGHVDEDGDKTCDVCLAENIDKCPFCGRAPHKDRLNEIICIVISILKLVMAFYAMVQ